MNLVTNYSPLMLALGVIGLVALAACIFRDRKNLFFLCSAAASWTILIYGGIEFAEMPAYTAQPLGNTLILLIGIALAVIFERSLINRFVYGFFGGFVLILPLACCSFPFYFVGAIVCGVLSTRTEEARHFFAGAAAFASLTWPFLMFYAETWAWVFFGYELLIGWALTYLAGYAAYQQAAHQGLFLQTDTEPPLRPSTLE